MVQLSIMKIVQGDRVVYKYENECPECKGRKITSALMCKDCYKKARQNKNLKHIIALISEGCRDVDIAYMFDVSREYIRQIRNKHLNAA